ncbi:aldehyde dehydrogenase family protein, partial [Klebsiella aerogenes]|nr:aldehyde dehydrogenase family protein [Klebsiella aerogenes]
MQHNLLINGKLVAGEGEVLPVFNPANGEAIIEIAEATEAQVDAAVNAADRA